MTNTPRIRFTHWLLTLGVVPVLGAGLGWWLLFHDTDSPAVAPVAAAFASGAIDYVRRRSPFCAVVGTVAGVLAYILSYGLLIGLFVLACSSGGCMLD